MRIKHLLVLLSVGLTLSGCGGTSLFSPFVGTFLGNWTQSSPADSGAAEFIVLPGGSLSGTMHDNSANADYTISGTMSQTGVVAATLSPSEGTLAGTMGFSLSNQLIGTLVDTGGTLNSISFTLVQQ